MGHPVDVCTLRVVQVWLDNMSAAYTTLSLAKSDEFVVVVVVVVIVIMVVVVVVVVVVIIVIVVAVVGGGGRTVVSDFSGVFPDFPMRVVYSHFVSCLGALGLNLDLCFCLLSLSRQLTAVFSNLLYIWTLFGF